VAIGAGCGKPLFVWEWSENQQEAIGVCNLRDDVQIVPPIHTLEAFQKWGAFLLTKIPREYKTQNPAKTSTGSAPVGFTALTDARYTIT